MFMHVCSDDDFLLATESRQELEARRQPTSPPQHALPCPRSPCSPPPQLRRSRPRLHLPAPKQTSSPCAPDESKEESIRRASIALATIIRTPPVPRPRRPSPPHPSLAGVRLAGRPPRLLLQMLAGRFTLAGLPQRSLHTHSLAHTQHVEVLRGQLRKVRAVCGRGGAAANEALRKAAGVGS